MEVRELRSEALVAGEPTDAEELFRQLSATSLDFRAVDALQDWCEELWTLSMDVRKLIPESAQMSKEDLDQLSPRAWNLAVRSGVKRKSKEKIRRETLAHQAQLRALYARLIQLRKAVWFDIRLEDLPLEAYLARIEEESATLARRLRQVQGLMPTSNQSARAAGNYMTQADFWGSLERPSQPIERERATRALIELERMKRRVKRYYEERHRVIFDWEEPQTEWTDADELAARDSVFSKFEELGMARADVEKYAPKGP